MLHISEETDYIKTVFRKWGRKLWSRS